MSLEAVHRAQVHRDPWPEFEAFDPERYPRQLRVEAARQWAARARAEHGSVHQFSQLTHVLCEARAPMHLLGALARLITDEVRHVELCAELARAYDPERTHHLPAPATPWPAPPTGEEAAQARLGWAARAIMIASCLGETISRPILDALAVVATCPLAEAVCRQILRDEHLHATFGWEALPILLAQLDAPERAALDQALCRAFAGFERTTTQGVALEEVVDRELVIGPGDPGCPNLGTLRPVEYATIFYATLEGEVFPRLEQIGLDARRAWRARPQLKPGS